MKIKISKEVKIGIYAVVTIVAMYWVFNFLKGRDLLNKYQTYYAVFENVEGLTATAPVYLKGLKVGNVSKITFEKTDLRFTVALRVESSYGVPEDSKAEIYGTDIMGNKAVRILMGSSPKLATSDDYLQSSVASDLTNMVANELLPLKDKIMGTLNNLNTTITAINNVLNEDTQNNLKGSISNLNSTLAHVESLSSALNSNKKHLTNSLENIDAFSATLRNNGTKIDRIADNLVQVSDSLRMANLKQTIDNLNALLGQANDTSGTVGKLLHDGELYTRLSNTVNDLDLLLIDLKANPKRYVKLSLF